MGAQAVGRAPDVKGALTVPPFLGKPGRLTQVRGMRTTSAAIDWTHVSTLHSLTLLLTRTLQGKGHVLRFIDEET